MIWLLTSFFLLNRTITALSRAQRSLATSLMSFQFECIGNSQTDDEIVIAGSLKEFGRLINAIEDERDRMVMTHRFSSGILLTLSNKNYLFFLVVSWNELRINLSDHWRTFGKNTSAAPRWWKRKWRVLYVTINWISYFFSPFNAAGGKEEIWEANGQVRSESRAPLEPIDQETGFRLTGGLLFVLSSPFFASIITCSWREFKRCWYRIWLGGCDFGDGAAPLLPGQPRVRLPFARSSRTKKVWVRRNGKPLLF